MTMLKMMDGVEPLHLETVDDVHKLTDALSLANRDVGDLDIFDALGGVSVECGGIGWRLVLLGLEAYLE